MKETIQHFKSLVDEAHVFLYETHDFMEDPAPKWMYEKTSPEKWSKIEIFGHLIDSGINNLQRFTEIHFSESPYQVRTYAQNELVKSNKYQEAIVIELCDFWITLNERIITIIENQSDDDLKRAITLPDGEASDLEFLMTDYVRHLEHHLRQIMA